MEEFSYQRLTTSSELKEYLSHQVSQVLMGSISIIHKIVDAVHKVINEGSNG